MYIYTYIHTYKYKYIYMLNYIHYVCTHNRYGLAKPSFVHCFFYLPTPPLVVDRANASLTGGCQKSPKCVIDKGGGGGNGKPCF